MVRSEKIQGWRCWGKVNKDREGLGRVHGILQTGIGRRTINQVVEDYWAGNVWAEAEEKQCLRAQNATQWIGKHNVQIISGRRGQLLMA